jgi:DNA-binding protein HU-beta
MRARAKVTTGFPSAAKVANRLGVSKRVARDLSLLAEQSLKTGEFVLPGVGRLVRVDRKARIGRNPATGEAIKIPAKKVVKFRVSKAMRDSIVPAKKKWPGMPRYSRDSAFLNIPYDDRYANLYFAFIAGLCAFGLEPRATLEIATGERRLDRIFDLMTSCHYSFHDLSRVQIDHVAPRTPRFNMPFELVSC